MGAALKAAIDTNFIIGIENLMLLPGLRVAKKDATVFDVSDGGFHNNDEDGSIIDGEQVY
jgi:hypothetical protein